MKHLAAAFVCIAVLYGIDVLCFGGLYFSVAEQAVAKACALNWS